MGCGGSRLGGAAARAEDGGVVPLPAGLRPLLRRRLEEMKKRSHASVLKGNQTLSKKELLRHGSEDGEETEDNDGSLKSSAKVAPAPDHNVEEKKEVIYEKMSPKADVKEVKEEEEEEVVKKQEEDNHHHVVVDEAINVQKEENDGSKKDDNVVEAISVKKEGNDGINHQDDEVRMTNFDERMICPGSPSFRVYCIHVPSDDDEGKDGDDTRISMENESIIIDPKEEEEIVAKEEKRERKGKRFGMALPRKYLANVTAPCYAGRGCMGNTHSRLVQEKSIQ